MFNLQQATDLIGLTKSRKPGTEDSEKYIPDEYRPENRGPREVFLVWEAMSRPVKQGFGNKLNRTFMMIGIVIALMLVILQEFFLIFVIASLIFVSHVLSKAPPENIKYEVSSHGVSVDEQEYFWSEIRRFFFIQEESHTTLVLDMQNSVPSRIYLSINAADRDELKEIFAKRVLFLETPPVSFFDKTYNSVVDKFNS